MEEMTLYEFVTRMTFEQFNRWIANVTCGGTAGPEDVLRWKSYLEGKVV